MAGPFDVAHPAAGSTVSLGAVPVAPPAALPTTPMGMMGMTPPPAPNTMGSLGAAGGAQLFPTIAALPVGPPQARAAGAGLGAVPSEPPPPAPTRAPTQLELAQAGQASENQTIAEILASNRIQTGSRANVLRPLEEAKAQTFRGGGELAVPEFQPQPMAPLPRNEGETDEEYAARTELFADVDLRQQRETYDRAVGEAQAQAGQLGDVRDIGARGHLGMGEAQLQAAEGVGEAQLTQAERVAGVQAQAAQLQMDATEQARAADQERRDEADQQRMAIEESQTIQTAARKKLMELPALDAGRFWKSQSGASKFFAVIGSMAGGMIGSTAVPEHFERMAQMDLEEQKANAAQTFDATAAAEGAVQKQVGMYQQLLDAAGDQQIADQMYLNLQREDMASLLEAEIARTSVPLQARELQATLVGVRQNIEQQKQAIDLAMATTPRRIATRHDPLGGRTRRLLEKRMETGEEREFELTKLGIGREGKALTAEQKLASEAGAKEEKRARGEGGYLREAAQLADKIAEPQAIIEAIKDLRRDFEGGMPGVGPFPLSENIGSKIAGMTGGVDKAHEFRMRVRNIGGRGLREATGAAATEDEQQEQFELLMEGAEDIGGEDKVLANLAAYEAGLQNKIDIAVRGRSREAIEHLTRNKVIPESDAINVGRAPQRDVVRRK